MQWCGSEWHSGVQECDGVQNMGVNTLPTRRRVPLFVGMGEGVRVETRLDEVLFEFKYEGSVIL